MLHFKRQHRILWEPVRFLCFTVGILCFAWMPFAGAVWARGFENVWILAGEHADDVENRCARLLADRLQERTGATARIRSEGPQESGLTIHFGTAASYAGLCRIAKRLKVSVPQRLDPGREGFVLASSEAARRQMVVAMGSDRRGLLYAVGEILRRCRSHGDGVSFPERLHVRRAPRWPVRGLNVAQGHTMRQLTGARKWTKDELRGAYLDYAMAGANTFRIAATDHETFSFLKNYGLDAIVHVSGNSGSGPPQWQAKEAIGRTGYLSPAVAEARAALLERREKIFRQMPPVDYVHFKSGDGGGDESEAAAPYGRTFIRLCEDYARILHRYHPHTKVFLGNQKLDNAGDRAIFEHFQTHKDTLLDGICYGPGSNAMGWTPGRRQDHRADLFEYARRGALSGYLREMLHQLPPDKSILLFSDLTHWVYSQYGLMDHKLIPDRNSMTPPRWDFWMYARRPSEAMAMVYDRRTFHARPRNYYRVFQETTEFALGDVAYSEGHHDHFNQWMYQRLFWNPHQTVEAVVDEYARTYFGPEASGLMRDAIFMLEGNLQTPIHDNAGIDRLIALVETAGQAMPAHRREHDYLWRQYAQKAYLDKVIQLDVRRQRAVMDDAMQRLRAAFHQGGLRSTVEDLSPLSPPGESAEMRRLRSLAERLGQESNRIFGVRNVGLFNLNHDFCGLGWLAREIRRASDAADEDQLKRIVERIVYYEDPGVGGFYDNAGVPEASPHLVNGWPYGESGFSGFNRRSQRTVAFTTEEERGVAFRYTGLDPDAAYRARLTLVRPRYLPRFGKFQEQTSQSVYADEHLLGENVELPEFESDFFEFDVPREATADGELLLWMKKQPGIGEGLSSDVAVWRNTGGWGTLVSEVWLMKKGAPKRYAEPVTDPVPSP